jgi:hypothetical protein
VANKAKLNTSLTNTLQPLPTRTAPKQNSDAVRLDAAAQTAALWKQTGSSGRKSVRNGEGGVNVSAARNVNRTRYVSTVCEYCTECEHSTECANCTECERRTECEHCTEC